VELLSGHFQVYNIVETGELADFPVKGELKAELKPERVLIIVDDDEKVIWLWKGTDAGVRLKFIAARQGQTVRSMRGLVYKVLSIDGGDEPDEFLALLGLKAAVPRPKPQVAVQVELPDRTLAITPKGEAPSRPAPTPTITPSRAPMPSPAKAASPASRPVQTAPVSPRDLGQEYNGAEEQWSSQAPRTISPAPAQDDIIGRVQNIQPPPGYRRELVVIGSEVFTTTDRTVSFLGKSSTSSQLERTRNLPDGPFFGGEFTPRILVEGGRVLATEFLKKTAEGKRGLREATQDADVSALLDLFRITTGANSEAEFAEESDERGKRKGTPKKK
jgi:hypothetical protein